MTPSYMMDRGYQGKMYNTDQTYTQANMFDEQDFTGWGNQRIVPELNNQIILDHIQKIQRANQIEPSLKLEGTYNLTIEMETGAGKTYTYIKTMYELNKHYGWSKFIIVVPSIAIREGVYKSFQMTQEHFAEEYGKKIRYFIYNSSQLPEIDRFASDNSINVMIINSQAFNAKGKDARRIYMKLDEFRSRRPIDIIAKTNPIVIIDEPQSVEGKQTKKNLEEFHPLMTLRYSATHKSDSIGERIGNALIRVEPWKLLEALQEKLRVGISLGKNKMASRIMKDGPKLATKEPGKQIPKGYDAVIEKAMSEPVCVVWGPPGTGKTHTMAELAINSMNAGKTVLIVSHSNVSVDGVAKKIDELLRKSNQTAALKAGKILRYGYVRDEELNKNPYVNSFYYTVTKNPALNEKLDKLQAEYDKLKHTKGLDNPRVIEIREDIGKIRSAIREQEQHYVSEASVIATTISKIVIDGIFDNKKYDVVMFDEVSMAYVLQVVCAVTFAREHFICVGDFMQLAPIAQSEKKDILCQDIFAYLGINRSGHVYYHPWLVMLNEQRRMHPQIAGFSNQYVYDGLLLNHPDTRTNRNEIVNAELFSKQAINLIDLSGCYCAASKNADNSRFNILSAMISFAIAVKTEKNVETVSIITPYAAQTRLVRAMELDYREHNDTQIRCATVHQFQGSESDVVIFDAVESYPSRKPGWLMGKDFNSIKRLINVAVTRAKGKLVTVANSKFWSNNYENTMHLFYRLISYLKDKGNTVRHEKDRTLEALVDELSLKGGPTFYLNANVYMDIFLKDIRSARGKIVISLPCGKLNPESESVICQLLVEEKQQGIQVLIKCNDYAALPDAWKKYTWGTSNAVFPLVMIDEKITWYGVPDASWKFKDGADEYHTVCPIVCRLDGKHTAELIRSLSDLEYRETDKGKKQLSPRPETPTDDPNGAGGLSEYVSQNIKCPDCKKPLKMTKGKSGKTILWCKECKKTHLLSPDDINHYMLVKHVKCPIHKCDMTAKVGKYGLYIKCDAGHNMKPEEI